jgi:flagellar hook assembly protein FlgD
MVVGPRLEIGANPFGEELSMRLLLKTPSRVGLEVYDIQGRRVRSEEYGMRNGTQHFTWDGRDDGGNNVGSGIYWIRLRAGDEAFSRRVVRIR